MQPAPAPTTRTPSGPPRLRPAAPAEADDRAPTIVLDVPSSWLAERAWIADVIFTWFLGFRVDVRPSDRRDVELTLAGDPAGLRLAMPDHLFAGDAADRLTPRMRPEEPLARWRVREELGPAWPHHDDLPVIFGPRSAASRLRLDGSEARLELDVLGSVAYMLGRYEEVLGGPVDAHDRFPATSSLAWREGFLDRPVCDEYVAALRIAMSRLWPRLPEPGWRYRPDLSFDVDWPELATGHSLRQRLRRVGGVAWRRRAPVVGLRGTAAALSPARTRWRTDPAYNFDWILRELDRRSLRTTFFVIAGEGRGDIDGFTRLGDPAVRRLISTVHGRGHAIGLHPSYRTHPSGPRLAHEFEELRETAASLGVRQEAWGSRHHYLRWRTPATAVALEEAGLDYDTTLGFADSPGFRCGTCRRFPLFDPLGRRALRVVERPLIAMDVSLTVYEGLDAEAQVARVAGLCREVRRHAGEFVVLWHNSSILSRAERRVFLQVLEEIR